MPPKKTTPVNKQRQASLTSFFQNSAKKKEVQRDHNDNNVESSSSSPVRTSPRRLNRQESKFPLDSTQVKKVGDMAYF
jgi:hypothetical protein